MGTTCAWAATLNCGSGTWPSVASGTHWLDLAGGEAYHVDLGQPVGHEPAFRPPAVVVSVDILNNGPGGLVVVVPITTAGYGLRSHVELEPVSCGLGHTSWARCDQLRVVSVQRLSHRQGMISPQQMQAIDRALRFVLDL